MNTKTVQYTISPECKDGLSSMSEELTLSQGRVLSILIMGISDQHDFPEWTRPPRAATRERKAITFRMDPPAYTRLVELASISGRPMGRLIDYIVSTHRIAFNVVEV